MNKAIEKNKAWIDETWNRVDAKLSRVAVKSREKIPYTTVNGEHDNKLETDPAWWTNGFWGGMMWLMYKGTGNEEYKKTAEHAEELMDKAFEDVAGLHHDVGFMWHLMSGANYRLTGNKKSYNRELIAAALLASRYNPDGRFIRAWNADNAVGWSIIDCMMNIPLLYRAAEEIGAPRYKKIAMNHADMAVRDHVRADGSVNHIVEHDVDTGAVVRTLGGQGYGEGSCWSRGLAWAVYGMVLSYVHTKKQDYLDAAKRCANFFIASCARTGYKAEADFMSPTEPVYYDSTAGVCAACGILEIAKCVSESESEMYTEAAINILKATDKNFCDYSDREDALVLMGSERYPHGEDDMKCVHIPIIYADFFYVEALLKLKGDDFLIW